MAHERLRYAQKHLTEALSFSPVVGVLGQRQVGKTTLIESLSSYDYRSFDLKEQRDLAEEDPDLFVSQPQKISIDECQKVPNIFPAIKYRVQKDKRPGQFVLTGSIRFTSRKAIHESLTGRIHNIEILPISKSELYYLKLDDFTKWPTLSERNLLSLIEERAPIIKKGIDQLNFEGGLPGICFLRNASHRQAKFKSHLETLLERDLKLIIQTTIPIDNLQNLLKYLAFTQGQAFNLLNCSKEAQISQNSIKKLLYAFENMFLIRRILTTGFEKAPTFYFEDQGMAYYLSHQSDLRSLTNFAFSQLFAKAHYNYMNVNKLTRFTTKAGVEVPLVFHINGTAYGFFFDQSSTLSKKAISAASVFLKNFSSGYFFVLHEGKTVKKISNRFFYLPISLAI